MTATALFSYTVVQRHSFILWGEPWLLLSASVLLCTLSRSLLTLWRHAHTHVTWWLRRVGCLSACMRSHLHVTAHAQPNGTIGSLYSGFKRAVNRTQRSTASNRRISPHHKLNTATFQYWVNLWGTPSSHTDVESGKSITVKWLARVMRPISNCLYSAKSVFYYANCKYIGLSLSTQITQR